MPSDRIWINKTTAQVAVVTVKTLDGQPIDEYGLTLLRQWGLGNKEKNNGALILVAVDDRQSRIEVGYGLEGVLPDGLTGRIQDQQMLPYFKQGQYEKGIVQGYLTVATTVAKSYDVKLEGVRYNGGAQQGTGDTPMPGWMKALIAVGLIVLVIVDHMFFGGIITRSSCSHFCAAEDAEAVAAVSEEAPAAAAVPAGAGKNKNKGLSHRDSPFLYAYFTSSYSILMRHRPEPRYWKPLCPAAGRKPRILTAARYRPSSPEGHARATVLLREL